MKGYGHLGPLLFSFPLAVLIGFFPAAAAGQSRPKPLILTGDANTNQPTDALAQLVTTSWKPLFRGVDVCESSTIQPRPLQARSVRVDLQEPGIDFLVTPSNGDAPKDVNARTTSDFLSEFKCQVAINGSVFDVFAKSNRHPMDVEGLSLSRGDLYSEPNEWDALLIGTNRDARVVHSPVDPAGAWNGLSGFFACLFMGTNYGTMKDRHPRSLVGVSKDGKYLYLLVVDGRQPGYSDGVTTAEAAEWIHRLGAYSALNLDGGGSTTLVIQGTNGSPEILNRPSGPPPGSERRVANHLGVFAEPLQASAAAQK